MDIVHQGRLIESLDYFLLSDYVSWLGRRWSTRLCRYGDYFGCEDIFLKEALMDEFIQVSSETPIMDGLVLFTIAV